ncbi:DUF6603 domain-containing protein [Algirhabdus cladophorae]|uniref:DUF6603 domain-containing protein n=1 Tax=Algirhabdus cladophorae TaxID=3377108 RepID=UPI003B846978
MSVAATLLGELEKLLDPAISAAQDPEQPEAFLDFLAEAHVDAEVLFQLQSLTVAVRALAATAAPLKTAVAALGGGSVGVNEIKSAVSAVKATVAVVKDLKSVAKMPDIPPGFEADTSERVIDHLIGIYFSTHQPRIAAILEGLGLLDAPDAEEMHSWRVHPETLASWVRDPAQAERDLVGWGTSDFDHRIWVARLAALAQSLGVPVETDTDALAYLDPALTQLDPIPPSLTASLLLLSVADAAGSAFVMAQIEGLPATQAGADGGFGLGLLGEITGTTSHPIDAEHTLTLSSTARLGQDTFLSIRPGATAIIGAGAPPEISVTLEAAPNATGPGDPLPLGPVILTPGKPKVTTSFTAGASGTVADIRFDFTGSTIEVSLGEADGFVSKLMAGLPGAELDLTLGYNTGTGPYFDTDGGLVKRVPLMPSGKTPAAIEALTIGLRPGGPGVSLSGGLDVAANIGPLFARLEGLGAAYDLDLTDLSKALDARPSFMAPSGAAFTIDLSAIKGGGAVSRDRDTGRYSGALALELPSFGLHAFGLVDTGGGDYSMLLFVGSSFAPIPIGFGFTLNGVGGLMGLHRDVDVEALFASVRTGGAQRLLAPEDPVRDAQALVAEAATIFPAKRGQYVFGPTVKLGWGSPKELVSLDLALAITLPEPLRIILIGTLKAALPDERVSILKLNVDVAGVLDLSASRFDMEGRIHDSSIQLIPIEGGFALLSAWGRSREFAFSVGGLHPAFPVPAGFPDLTRLGANLSKSSALTLRLQGYLAVTSNSIQLGARVDLAAKAAGFGVAADLSFDALLILDPFRLDLAISAGASIKSGSSTIASLRLKGRLQGPGPWQIEGTATLEILFFDVDIRVSKSFGSSADPLPSSTDLHALLVSALSEASAWSAPVDARGVSFVLGDVGENLLPDAPLQVAQKVAPLDMRLEMAGGRPLAQPFTATLDAVEIGGQRRAATGTTVEPFALGQFIAMSDEAKLSAPAFEDKTAGAIFDAGDLRQVGQPVTAPAGPEFIVVDAAPRPETEAKTPPPSTLSRMAAPAVPAGRITVRDEGWSAADASLSGGARSNWTDLHQRGAIPMRSGEAR